MLWHLRYRSWIRLLDHLDLLAVRLVFNRRLCTLVVIFENRSWRCTVFILYTLLHNLRKVRLLLWLLICTLNRSKTSFTLLLLNYRWRLQVLLLVVQFFLIELRCASSYDVVIWFKHREMILKVILCVVCDCYLFLLGGLLHKSICGILLYPSSLLVVQDITA